MLASFQGTRKMGGSAWYTLLAHAQSLLGNLHTIRYTNHALTVYVSIPADKLYCRVMVSEKHSGRFKVKNAIALTAMACIISFRVMDELVYKVTSLNVSLGLTCVYVC